VAEQIVIGYFLEDIAQESFLKALVDKVAKGINVASSLTHAVWNAAGGRGQVLDQLRRFVRDVQDGRLRPFHILVIAIDGNCCTYQDRKNEIDRIVLGSKYSGMYVLALPNPHIERWYMLDPQGFNKAFGAGALPVLPTYKCERGLYKKVMREAIASSGIMAQFGGYEYGERIVEEMDLYEAAKADSSLKHFIDDLSDALTRITTQEKVD